MPSCGQRGKTRAQADCATDAAGRDRRGQPTAREWSTTTRRDKDARPAPDLVDQNFTGAAPNRLWVADITYRADLGGFLNLAVVLDAFSRRIVGWSMANHLRTELMLDALGMAVRPVAAG